MLVGDGGGSPAEVTDNSSDLFPETPISCRAVKSPGLALPHLPRAHSSPQTGSPPRPESPRKKWGGVAVQRTGP